MRLNEILKKLEIEPISKESFQIFISSLKTILRYNDNEDLTALADWNVPILHNISKLTLDELRFIKSELKKKAIPIKGCQSNVQKLIPQEKRKKFAAYYTIHEGAEFMVNVAKEYLNHLGKQNVVIADPFIGSGITLTTLVEKIGIKKIKRIWGVEPLSLPAFVAFTSLLEATNGRKDLIDIIVGDAFRKIPQVYSPLVSKGFPKVDILLTNPPFTRWKYLAKHYRDYILASIEQLGYKKYITRREISLQTLSMFLSDYILNKGGLLVSVLPASTFYTIYGKGYKTLLKQNYEIHAMVELESRASFSEDSSFKEVIIVAVKGNQNNRKTAFIELNTEDVEELAKKVIKASYTEDLKVNLVNLSSLPRFLDINWSVFFGKNEVKNIIIDILKQSLRNETLQYWDAALGRKSIIRGVEMYGPEFFFLPNKYWKVVEKNNSTIKIQNLIDNTELKLSKHVQKFFFLFYIVLSSKK